MGVASPGSQRLDLPQQLSLTHVALRDLQQGGAQLAPAARPGALHQARHLLVHLSRTQRDVITGSDLSTGATGRTVTCSRNRSSWRQLTDSLRGSSSLEERRGLISTHSSDWLKEISLICMASCTAATSSCSLMGAGQEAVTRPIRAQSPDLSELTFL